MIICEADEFQARVRDKPEKLCLLVPLNDKTPPIKRWPTPAHVCLVITNFTMRSLTHGLLLQCHPRFAPLCHSKDSAIRVRAFFHHHVSPHHSSVQPARPHQTLMNSLLGTLTAGWNTSRHLMDPPLSTARSSLEFYGASSKRPIRARACSQPVRAFDAPRMFVPRGCSVGD